MNTRLQAIAGAQKRPVRMRVTAGPASDDTGASALPSSLPKAGWMLADRGCIERQGDKGLPLRPERKNEGRQT